MYYQKLNQPLKSIIQKIVTESAINNKYQNHVLKIEKYKIIKKITLFYKNNTVTKRRFVTIERGKIPKDFNNL